MRRSLPLRRQLLLLTSGLLLAVIVGHSWLVYREVRQAALLVARDRLQGVTAQLADLFEASAAQRVVETSALARRSEIIRYLRAPAPGTRAAAAGALDSLARQSELTATVEVWAADGRHLVTVPSDTLRLETTLGADLVSRAASRDSAAVGELRVVDGKLLYPVIAAARDGGRTLGYVVQRRRVTASPRAAAQLNELVGSDAAIFIGNARGDVWTDLVAVAPPPPVALGGTGQEFVEYVRPDAGPRLAVAAPVGGSPWVVLVEFPRSPLLAGPRRVLRRMALIAVLVLATGAGAAWALSRGMTRPIRELALAADAISGGDYSRRLRVTRDDELGQLATAFNTMTQSIQESVAALGSSADRYRRLFESNPHPMWVYDLETLAFIAVNDAAVHHYGYTRDEFARMTIKDIRPVEDVPALLESSARDRPGVEQAGVWRHCKKDGAVIDVEITSHRLNLDGRRARLVLAHDVTEQRRADAEIRRLNTELEQLVEERTAELRAALERLRASEAQFRTLAATANDAIVTADAEGCITYFNPGAERIFGHAADEVLGRPLTVLMPDRFHDAHRQGIERYLATGRAQVIGRTIELTGRRKDGTEFPVELSLASWSQDRRPAFAAILRDITTRNKTDEALRRYAAELESANEELEAFSYSVSHDLRAPLRSIHGFSDALLEDCSDQLDERGTDHLRRVCAAAERMSRLIDDLLELSRVSRAELGREPVDLGPIARRIAAELRRGEPDRSVQFRIAEGLLAYGDSRLLGLVVQNLLDNAWKFTSGQGHATIEVGSIERDGHRAYFVRDDGVGFDMAYAAKLFGPFQRLHGASEFPGSGVGLAIVQRIVHRHGGRVWAEAAVGTGATFYFTLADP